MAPRRPPAPAREERFQPLALIGITLIALLGFAIFFLSFLVAPMAILMVFYVGFAASDRKKSSSGGHTPGSDNLAREAQARQAASDRTDEELGGTDAPTGPARGA